MKRTALILLASTLMIGVAHAEDDGDGDRKRGHKGPPEAALEACSAAVSGDPCSFEGRRGESREGTCEAPDEKPLACRPEGGKPRQLVDEE